MPDKSEYTSKTCDEACIETDGCIEFMTGRRDGINKKTCSLFSAECSKLDDENYDMYLSSPKVLPSTMANICTHRK